MSELDGNELWLAFDKIEEAIGVWMHTDEPADEGRAHADVDEAIAAYVKQNTRLLASLQERAAGARSPAEPADAAQEGAANTLSSSSAPAACGVGGHSAAGRAHNPTPAARPSLPVVTPERIAVLRGERIAALRKMFDDPKWADTMAEGLFKNLLEMATLLNSATIVKLFDHGAESMTEVQSRSLCAIELKAREHIRALVADIRASAFAVAAADHDDRIQSAFA